MVLQAAEVIETAAQRAAALTRQLLDFSRKTKPENAPVDIHKTIDEVCRLLNRAITKRITISKHLNAGNACVLGDGDQIQQVILNLAVNARDAMPEGGTMSVETSTLMIDEEYRLFCPGASPGMHLVVAVTDTGSGMTRELQERIFEPFFTFLWRSTHCGSGLRTSPIQWPERVGFS